MKPLSSAWLTPILSVDPQRARGAAKLWGTLLLNWEIRRIESTMFVIGDLTLPTLEVYAHAGIVGESEVGPLVTPNICEEKELEILLKTLLVIIV